MSRREFTAVVHANTLRSSPLEDDSVQRPRHPLTRQAGVHLERQTFSCEGSHTAASAAPDRSALPSREGLFLRSAYSGTSFVQCEPARRLFVRSRRTSRSDTPHPDRKSTR